jgi:hypothetical protein
MYSVKWPSVLASMFRESEMAFLKVDILGLPELFCFWSDISFEAYLFLYTLGPLICTALLGIPVAVAWARGLHRRGEAELPLEETEELPHDRWNKAMHNFWNTTSECL